MVSISKIYVDSENVSVKLEKLHCTVLFYTGTQSIMKDIQIPSVHSLLRREFALVYFLYSCCLNFPKSS